MHINTSIVGNTKLLAHLIPTLIPPVDRQYTLAYLYGKIDIKNDIDLECKTLKNNLIGFFYPITQQQTFIIKATQWLQQQTMYPWNTSHLKIIDNLIIGS